MLRAVVDVNVLVSAHLNAHGPPARTYRAWLAGEFELVASDHLIGELELVGARPHLAARLDPQAILVLVARLRTDSVLVDDPAAERVVRADSRDDYLVALARAAGAHVIVTGDRHLLDLEELKPPALEPRAFLALLEQFA